MANGIGSGQLRINDIVFDVPPQNIQIIKRDQNLTIPTLRTSTSTKVKTGQKEIMFVIDLTFATGYNYNTSPTGNQKLVDVINKQLAPLIIQTRKCPFASIENEKIRKELRGELGDNQSMPHNMAVCIKSIKVSYDTQQPELIRVQLVLKWFNYLPYTPDFKYVTDLNKLYPNGAAVTSNTTPALQPVDDPRLSTLYQEFYTNGTMGPTGSFINEIVGGHGENSLSGIDKDITIVYREYTNNLPAMVDPSEWTQVQSTVGTQDSPLFFRYRSFPLSQAGRITDPNGAVIPIHLEMMLETMTPSLPLQGHTVPTLQFLGVADATFNVTLFANAQLDYTGQPIGTSNHLAAFSNVLESVNKNAQIYRMISRKDPIYLVNPLFNLMNYNVNTNETISYYPPGSKNKMYLAPFAAVPCMVNSYESKTVEGMPFCSTIDVQFIEQYRRSTDALVLSNQGLSGSIRGAISDGLAALATQLGITLNTQSGYFEMPAAKIAPTDMAGALNALATAPSPDLLSLGNNLITLLNNLPNHSNDIVGMLSSFNFNNSVTPTGQRLANGVLAVGQVIGVSQGPNPGTASELFESLSNQLVKYALANRPPFLAKLLTALNTINTTTPTSTYPDMLLPVNSALGSRSGVGKQPDYYWENKSDDEAPGFQNSIASPAINSFTDYYGYRVTQLCDPGYVGQNVPPQLVDNGQTGENNQQIPTPVLPHNPNPPAVTNACVASSGTLGTTTSKNLLHNFVMDGKGNDQLISVASQLRSFKDDTYTMRRAMPTFKLYFLNDGNPIDKTSFLNVYLNFDDFYNVHAIKEIRLIKSKDICADTLVIQLENMNQEFINSDFPQVQNAQTGYNQYAYATSGGENITQRRFIPSAMDSLNNIILTEGTKIQLRLGNDADPDNLDIEFNGRITQISGTDVLEIVCQSHAMELELITKGTTVAAGKFQWNYETNDILTQLIAYESEEVQNFGGRAISKILGDVGLLGKWFGGVSISDNFFAPKLGYSWAKTELQSLVPAAGVALGIAAIGGFNPFSLVGAAVVGGGIALWGAVKALYYDIFKVPFNVYNQTVWDVVKELELRHPDCIASVVPYDQRMTLYFGYPEQFYFYRTGSFSDQQLAAATGVLSSVGPAQTQRERLDSSLQTIVNSKMPSSFAPNSPLNRDPTTGALKTGPSLDAAYAQVDTLLNSVKPFRNYHFVTSDHDIVLNEIRADYSGTFNAINVLYPEDGKDANLDGSTGFKDYTQANTASAVDFGANNVPPNFIRTGTFVQHNARKFGNVRLYNQYGISLLKKSLEGLYKGELVILGRSGIKPYDIIYIFDRYNDMYGAIEVREVIQTMSYETGWVTSITPGMVIFTNNQAGRAHMEMMGQVLSTQYLLNEYHFFGSKFATPETPKTTGFNSNTTSVANSPALNTSATNLVQTSAISKSISLLPVAVAARQGAIVANQLIAALPPSISEYGKAGFLTLLAPLFLDNITDDYISWAATREPLTFVPLKRNGRPWLLGLQGLNPTTIPQAVQLRFKQIEGKYLSVLGLFMDKVINKGL